MSEEERTRLISEITTRESQVAEMRSQVDAKTYETNRLQFEVEQARKSRAARVENERPMLKEHNGDVDHDDLTNAHIGGLFFIFSKIFKKKLKFFKNASKQYFFYIV